LLLDFIEAVYPEDFDKQDVLQVAILSGDFSDAVVSTLGEYRQHYENDGRPPYTDLPVMLKLTQPKVVCIKCKRTTVVNDGRPNTYRCLVCEFAWGKPSEINERYFATHGHGYGSVLSGDESAPLKTLTVDQLNALVNVVLWGDIHEIGLNEGTLGRMANPQDDKGNVEAETRLQIAAALVYLSGRLAEDLPLLQKESNG
jgi:hypothetical protein